MELRNNTTFSKTTKYIYKVILIKSAFCSTSFAFNHYCDPVKHVINKRLAERFRKLCVPDMFYCFSKLCGTLCDSYTARRSAGYIDVVLHIKII